MVRGKAKITFRVKVGVTVRVKVGVRVVVKVAVRVKVWLTGGREGARVRVGVRASSNARLST